MNDGSAKNKVLGLAGQAEILIGYLYNLIQSWSNFWVAIVENCTENGQWPAVILSSGWCMWAGSCPPVGVCGLASVRKFVSRAPEFKFHSNCHSSLYTYIFDG